MSASEWEQFTARKKPASQESDDWTRVTTVRHGTHLKAAVRIAEDRKIGAELIYDGKLISTRTKVVFFSPNTWGEGSRYGSLEFEVDWLDLLVGRNLYWLEPVTTYKLPIHRFLLSRGPAVSGLSPYDPVGCNGPLRLIDGIWLRTSADVCEILIDEDVPLSEVSKFAITTHHPQYCSVGHSKCEESGAGGMKLTSRRFQAALLGLGLKDLNHLMVAGGKLNGDVAHGVSGLPFALGGSSGFVGAVTSDAEAQSVLKGAMLLLKSGNRDGAHSLARLLKSADERDRILLLLIREHFDLPEWEWD